MRAASTPPPRILPVFIPHQGCPFQCIYCDQHAIGDAAPTDEELTARLADFCHGDALAPRQVAFYGGTFTALPLDEQQHWLDLVSPWLGRLDGVRLSTRPDCVDSAHLAWLKARGVRTIELGVQSFDDTELAATRRGYTGAQAADACRLVKDAGLELGVQLMPGLPGSSNESWRRTVDAALLVAPAFVRLYPLVVLRGTALERIWRTGDYTPLSLDEAAAMCAEAANAFEAAGVTVAKTGLHGDLAPDAILAGPWHAAFGECVLRRRMLARLPNALPDGYSLVVTPGDVSLWRGEGGWMLDQAKLRLGVEKIPIIIDSQQVRSKVSLSQNNPHQYW